MEFLHIAVRNLRRNERRSKLTIITIVIGVTVLMNVQGMFRGITATVYGRMMAMDTAQVQVEEAGYRAEARRFPLDRVIDRPEELAASLRALPGVAAVSARVDFTMEITNGTSGTRVAARGVSPEEAQVTELGTKILAGSLFAPGESGLALGSGLAAKLGLKVGDTAYFTALDLHSARNLGAAKVAAIFEYGYPLLDDYLVYLDIGQARAFLGLGDVASRLVIRGTDPEASAALTTRVTAALARPGVVAPGQALVAYEWKTFAENLVSTIETRLQLLGAILGTLFCLIIAGIFNTMAMNVQERYREIGTIRAIGIRRSALGRIFLLEGLVMGLAGCAIAAIPSTGVGLWLGIWGIDLSGIFPKDIPIPFGTALKAAYAPVDALRALCAGVGAAVLGSIIPARRAARLPITEAIGAQR